MTGAVLTYPNGTKRKSMAPWLHDSIEYYPHQIDGVRALAKRNGSFILADDMGLGKSLEGLTIFISLMLKAQLEGAKPIEKLLIVAPVTLKANWEAEFQKFTSVPATVLIGTPAKREKQIADWIAERGPRALILSYDQVRLHKALLVRAKFDVAIWDEAHYLKNPKAKRTIAAHGLKVPRNMMLTGTPIQNTVDELWSLFHMIDPKTWPMYFRFVNRYCVFGGWQNSQIVGVKNERELKSYLDKYMLRRLARDVLELKDPIPIDRIVEMLPSQVKLYNEVLSGILDNKATGEEEEIDNPLHKFTRLKQVTATTATFLPGTDDSCILDVAIEDIQTIVKQGNRVVVFTQFIAMIDSTRNRLNDLGIPNWEVSGRVKQQDRVPTVNEWANSVEPGVIVCGLQVAREGLNMTAARYGLFLDELFVPAANEQAVRRINRIGQDITQAVTIIKYKVKGTIWDRVQEILNTKLQLTDNIIEGDPNFQAKLREAVKEAMRESRKP